MADIFPGCSVFQCLKCGGGLHAQKETLRCPACAVEYPIEKGVPRFVSSDNYAQSFGYEWNKHSRTQLDSVSGFPVTEERFYAVTGWPKDLQGEKVLEAGCGMGRFTEIVLKTGAQVFSFDYSSAVDANKANNGTNDNLILFQSDIYQLPLKKESFDKILCLGVLQHCPDPQKAFQSLVPLLKPGGEIVIDVYDKRWRTYINPKYWLRPLTKRLPHDKLYRIIEKVIPYILPIKTWIKLKVPGGKYIVFFIPVSCHEGSTPYADLFSKEQLRTWSTLDTFDMLSPWYDKPQTLRAVRDWFAEADLLDVSVHYGFNGINARGRKKTQDIVT